MSITPQLMLERIKENLQLFRQWSETPDWVEYQHKYYCHLEAFVELMEEYDCGSTGGFGIGQPEGQNLLERAEWLIAKYGKTSKVSRSKAR